MRQRSFRTVAMLLCVPWLLAFSPFETANPEVEKGNKQLEDGKVKEALEHYNRGLEKQPGAPGIHYNRGVALARLGKLEEARKALLEATVSPDRGLKAKSFYNLGNVQYQLERYDEAINAYRRALQLEPRHAPSKWNLELALRQQRKKEKQQKKKPDDQKKEKKKQKDDAKQEQPSGAPDDKRQGGERDDEKQKPKQQQPKQDEQRAQPKPSEQQRQRVLDALDRNDKNLQRRRARAMQRHRRRPAKDW